MYNNKNTIYYITGQNNIVNATTFVKDNYFFVYFMTMLQDNQNKKELPPIYTPLNFGVSGERPILASSYDYSKTTSQPLLDMHYALELGIVLKGKVRRLRQNRSFDRAEGDVWLCGMLESHGFQVLECPCSVVVMDIWPPLVANLYFPEAAKVNWMQPFSQTSEKPLLLSDEKKQDFLKLGHRMKAATLKHDEFRQTRFRLLLIEALMLMMEDNHFGKKTSNHYNRIHPALTLVWESNQMITNKQAALECGYSVDAFITEFRKLMGISFTKFALRHRLHSAARDLSRSSAPLKIIASDWGFTDAAHLHHLFVKHYGCTPKEYRKRF